MPKELAGFFSKVIFDYMKDSDSLFPPTFEKKICNI